MRLFRRGESASTLDLLVAGLGNPGREYAATRHNVGWLVVDELATRHGGSWRSKFSGRLAEVRLGDLRLGLLKPETYMNESGRSIGAAARFFKVDPGSLLVVHDDVDLDEGRLQARLGGGLAGHNGLRSIAQTLGSQDFLRLRVGVGRPGPRRPPVGGRLRSRRVRPDRRRGGRRLARRGRRRDDGPRRPRGGSAALQLTGRLADESSLRCDRHVTRFAVR